MAPPGAATYNNSSASGTGQLTRVGTLGTAASWLVTIVVVLECFRAIIETNLRSSARAFLAGDLSSAQFLRDIDRYDLVTGVGSLIQIAAAIVSIVWLYLIAKNNANMQRTGTWGPGFAIGGWFAPPIFFVIPTLTLDQQWKADSPGTTISNWRQAPGSPLIWAWGVAFTGASVLPVIDVVTSDLFDATINPTTKIANSLANPGAIPFIVTVLTIVSGVMFAAIIRQLTARHTMMTGEATA